MTLQKDSALVGFSLQKARQEVRQCMAPLPRFFKDVRAFIIVMLFKKAGRFMQWAPGFLNLEVSREDQLRNAVHCCDYDDKELQDYKYWLLELMWDERKEDVDEFGELIYWKKEHFEIDFHENGLFIEHFQKDQYLEKYIRETFY
ncbi:MAG: hypothetical protein HKN40_00375 [Winogradskyella sp.]|uniref:hypothetical protein n=1 Tax=Winogradskyella sp. TaxID=1883156 RepID=UPI0017F09615|nr:hypothetical protein [Winogradskyella sp.]